MSVPRERVRALPYFSGLNERELQVLASTLKVQAYAEGDVIFREGEIGDSCYFLISGEVEIVKSFTDGARRVLCTMQRHAVFGQISLIDAGPRSASARAATQAVVYRLERADFDVLFSSGSRFALQFQLAVARAAAARLRETNRRLSLLPAGASAPEDPSAGEPASPEQLLAELNALVASSTPDSNDGAA